MRPLFLKELREHRWVILSLWLLCALGLTVLLLAAEERGSPMVAFQSLTVSFGVLMSLVIANRLVVREYSGRTQLFLETLPVSRGRVLAAKWLTGWMFLFVPMAICLLITLWASRHHVVLTPRFVTLVTLRSSCFLLFFYALAFAIGLTLRYRFIVWSVLVATAATVNQYAQIPWGQWAPIRLVSESMIFEHLRYPTADLAVTCLITTALVAITMTLALTAEGALVVALSRKMSPRIKVSITVVVIVILSIISILDERKPKPPFALKKAIKSSTQPNVAIGRVANASQVAVQNFADQLSDDLRGLQDYLALSPILNLSVVPDASLDDGDFYPADTADADGVVLRAALGSDHFDRHGFRAFALSQSVGWYTHQLATNEDRRWLRDGFSQWWIARDLPQRQDQLTLRAAVAGKILQNGHITLENSLRQWNTAREQLGDCLSDALAWRTVSLLAQELTPEEFRALAKSALAVRPPRDARALLFEPTLAQLLREVGAPTITKLSQQLQADLGVDQTNRAADLNEITLWPIAFKTTPIGSAVVEVHYQVGAENAVPPAFTVHYGELAPWQGALSPEWATRIDGDRSGVLPRTFPRGTLLFTSVELRNPQLDCKLRLGAQRWELQ